MFYYKYQCRRQLSSQSGNGGDPKKQCEEHTVVDDVFKECLKNPDCLNILLMSLHNLENQVNSVVKESAEYKKNRIKGNKQLQDINDSIS